MKNMTGRALGKEEKYVFTDCMAEDGGALHLKELILRGYRLLPLAGDGILLAGGVIDENR